jgi:N6-L-threonylcarbamoyladenine synthase
MIILGIETSCDETALSLIEANGDISQPIFNILGSSLHSQIEIHAQYGGVFPTMAKREHVKNIIPVFDSLLKKTDFKKTFQKSKIFSQELENQIKDIFQKETGLAENFLEYISEIEKPNIEMIAVTNGPGLEPALWVGINFAKALSSIWNIPLLPVNHMEGHILSVLSKTRSQNQKSKNNIDTTIINFPAIALLISGGHTEIVLVKSFGEYEIIGKTRDDAVGEAFDKVARLLELPYPGGPEISKLVAQFELEKHTNLIEIKLPRPMITNQDLDFSFSGLKTAVLYLIKKLKEEGKYNSVVQQQIAQEFQEAVIDVLFSKVNKAIFKYKPKSLIIGGGVIANKKLREKFLTLNDKNFKVLIPEMNLTTDNAVMIAFAGFISQFKKQAEINPLIIAQGNLEL